MLRGAGEGWLGAHHESGPLASSRLSATSRCRMAAQRGADARLLGSQFWTDRCCLVRGRCWLQGSGRDVER